MEYITIGLNSSHNKKLFSCGKDMLDTYLHKQAKQDIKRKLTACFILPDNDGVTIKGYYTLSSNGMPQDSLPESIRKRLPRSYTSLPSTLLGRLAVDSKFKGKGLEKLLLIDALKRSFINSHLIGSFAVIVDPLDQDAEKFYQKYGFILLPDSGKMFLPMKTIAQVFVKG